MPEVLEDLGFQVSTNKATDLTAKKAGDLAAATVHLFENDVTPSALTVVADLTECTYVGYASIAATGWTANETHDDGSVSTTTTNVQSFVGPAAGGGPTVYGYFIKSAGGGTPLIKATRFPNPVSLDSNVNVLNMVASFIIP